MSSALDLSRYVEVGDCHEWTGIVGCGKRSTAPIIKIKVDGKTVNLAARREVWKAAGRPIPDGHVVYSHCCNGLCVALDHLRCGKRGVHLKRRAALGLAKHLQSTRANLTKAARSRPTTKYTIDQARAVRTLACDGIDDEAISLQTGVGLAMVGDIRRGTAWAELVPAASVFGWRPAA